jgi:hypothetical protein
MKIGIIIPDRNDRPELLANCWNMIINQVFSENHFVDIKIVDFPPTDNEIDITKRYRIGYDYYKIDDGDIRSFNIGLNYKF